MPIRDIPIRVRDIDIMMDMQRRRIERQRIRIIPPFIPVANHPLVDMAEIAFRDEVVFIDERLFRDQFFGNGKLVKPVIPNEPKLWDKILYAVREVYEPNYTCIAGGAVRDYLLGLPPKDIDVFVALPSVDDEHSTITVNEIVEVAGSLGWKNIVEVNLPYGQNEIKNTLIFRASVFGYDVDFILTKENEGRKIVDGFDYHICQHWYDGELNSYPLAKRDIQKKQWTLIGEMDKDKKEHFTRVNKRHGGKFKLNEGEPWYQKFAGKEKVA